MRLVVDRTWGVWLAHDPTWTVNQYSAGWVYEEMSFHPECGDPGAPKKFRGTQAEAMAYADKMRRLYPRCEYEARKFQE